MSETLLARLRGLAAHPGVRRAFEVVLFIAFLLALNAWQSRDVRAGEVAALSYPTLDGTPFTSKSLHGKPTLLVVWAPWCGVCRLESQNVSWVQRLVGERANVVSLVVQYDALSQVHEFVERQEVDYPVLLGGRAGAAALGVNAYPTALFLDSRGRIERAAVGYTTTLGLLLRLLL